MFNYKQLALAIEMRTRYGKPVYQKNDSGFVMQSELPDLTDLRNQLFKLNSDYNMGEDDKREQFKKLVESNPLLQENDFKLTVEDEIDEEGYADVYFEIWYDSCSIHCVLPFKIRNGYQAHEKMLTDLVVSQLQYWS